MNNISFPHIAIYVSFRFHLFVPTLRGSSWTENCRMIMRQHVITYQESLLRMMKGNGGKCFPSWKCTDARSTWWSRKAYKISEAPWRALILSHAECVPRFEVSTAEESKDNSNKLHAASAAEKGSRHWPIKIFGFLIGTSDRRHWRNDHAKRSK